MSMLLKTLGNFFGVILRGQTYLNALYLLLALPLGVFYFTFLVTGLSLAIGMLLLWIGLLILVGVFAAWYGLAAFERWLTIALLREQIPPMTREDLSGKTVWQKLVAMFKNPVTWKGLAFLMARFPLGIFSFVVVVTLASISLSLMATPFYYQYVPGNMVVSVDGVTYFPAVIIDTLPEALLVSLAGFLAGLVSLHIFNGLAWLSAKFARLMLGNFSPAGAAPQPPVGSEPVEAAGATQSPSGADSTQVPVAVTAS